MVKVMPLILLGRIAAAPARCGLLVRFTSKIAVSPPRPTQPPALSRTGNEYQPKCRDPLWLRVKGRYVSLHLWINVWVAGKTV